MLWVPSQWAFKHFLACHELSCVHCSSSVNYLTFNIYGQFTLAQTHEELEL